MSDSFGTPWTIAQQAPLSVGFLRQEYWSGLPFPSPGDLPHPGIKSESPTWQMDSLPLSHQKSNLIWLVSLQEEERRHRHPGSSTMWRQRQGPQWCVCKPRHVKGCQLHQKQRDRHGPDPPLEPSESVWPCQYFIFGLLASRTMKESISVD